MFDNPGEKLRVIGVVYMVLSVVSAVILLLVMMIRGGAGGFLLGVLYLAIYLLLSWIGCVSIFALADAAVNAENAAHYAYEVSRKLDKLLPKEEKKPAGSIFRNSSVAASAQDYNKEPAWKRVQRQNQENQ